MSYFLKLMSFVVLMLSVDAWAQSFPNKPIKIIVAFTPGSGSDTQARLYGKLMEKELGQPVIVENRPGANGLIGLQALKAAPADGYTLGMGGAFLVVNTVMMKDAQYKVADFRPISGIVSAPLVLLVGAQSPYKTLNDLLDAAKRGNRSINIGTYTATYQMGSAWLSQVSGVPVTNVPYKGAAQAITDLSGGHLEAAMADLGSMKPLLRDGKIRALAISADKRSADFPNIPLFKEKFPEYEMYVWTALVARSETQPDVVTRLSAAMQKALATKESVEYITNSGFNPNQTSPDLMIKYQDDEYQRYKRIAQDAGIKPE